MATQFYGVPRGGNNPLAVVESGSTTSQDFEFAVDLTNNPTREQAYLALDAIKQKILGGIWPPA